MSFKKYRLDENTGSYERIVELFGKQVGVSVAFDSEETIRQTLAAFIKQVEKWIDWIKENKDTIEVELAKLYPGWLDEEGEWEKNLISKSAFVNKLTLTSILFFDNLSLYLFYDGGDTFFLGTRNQN